MADHKHLRFLKRGVKAWNRWREENLRIEHPALARIDLGNKNLTGANLSGANLSEAYLWYTRLTNADLTNADLWEASLVGAKLSGANLESVRLKRADFTEADLEDATLSGADLSGTCFHAVDLSKTQGLENVHHIAPSFISHQTLEMSKGKIPDIFLKGCGLVDWAILSAKLYDPNLRQDEIIDLTYRIAEIRGSSPIVPLSVFLSYSHEDAEFVDLVSKRLDDDGIRSWRDKHDLVAGPMEPQIDSAITAQRAVLLVLSENAVSSDWVPWEVERARAAEEMAGGYKLCPVALDDAWLDCGWPRHVISYLKTRYFVLPLHDWEDEAAFEPQYKKLKTGLGIYYRK